MRYGISYTVCIAHNRDGRDHSPGKWPTPLRDSAASLMVAEVAVTSTRSAASPLRSSLAAKLIRLPGRRSGTRAAQPGDGGGAKSSTLARRGKFQEVRGGRRERRPGRAAAHQNHPGDVREHRVARGERRGGRRRRRPERSAGYQRRRGGRGPVRRREGSHQGFAASGRIAASRVAARRGGPQGAPVLRRNRLG